MKINAYKDTLWIAIPTIGVDFRHHEVCFGWLNIYFDITW